MSQRRTLLIVQPGLVGLVLVRIRTTELFTCREAATALGVSLTWMHRHVRGRPGLFHQLGRPMLSRAEVVHLQQWLRQQRQASRQPPRHPPGRP